MTHTPTRNDSREGAEHADLRLLHDLKNMPKVTAPLSLVDDVRTGITQRAKSVRARKKYTLKGRLVLTLSGTATVVFLCILFLRGNDSPPSPPQSAPSFEAPGTPPHTPNITTPPVDSRPGLATEPPAPRREDDARVTSTSLRENIQKEPNAVPSPLLEGTGIRSAAGKDTKAAEHNARATRQETIQNVEFEVEYAPAQPKDAVPDSREKARISGLPIDSTKTDSSNHGSGSSPGQKPR